MCSCRNLNRIASAQPSDCLAVARGIRRLDGLHGTLRKTHQPQTAICSRGASGNYTPTAMKKLMTTSRLARLETSKQADGYESVIRLRNSMQISSTLHGPRWKVCRTTKSKSGVGRASPPAWQNAVDLELANCRGIRFSRRVVGGASVMAC